MPARKNAHLIGVEKTVVALTRAFGNAFWVRAQATLSLGLHSAPDPDIAVVPGPRRVDVNCPTEASLVVEVSDSTLWLDRTRKARLYAKAGIREYWVLDLVHRQLEVYRDPVDDPASRSRRRYAVVSVLSPAQKITPLAATQSVTVARLLP